MGDWIDELGRIVDGAKSPVQRAKDALDHASQRIHDREAAERARQPLPTLHRKVVDGVAYLRADDVAAVLEALGADPRAKRLAAKLRT